MIINHNITALNTHRQLGAATNAQAKSMEKLASGQRINKAGDDAAGLAISEKMRGQIRGLDQASRNAQDGISMIQTAEGALSETHDILQRMKELATQSANGSNQDADRKEIQKEINELSKEITRISQDTEFNKKKLINGDMNPTVAAGQTANPDAKALTFHIGANSGQQVSLEIKDMSAVKLGVGTNATAGTPGTPASNGADGQPNTADDVAAGPGTPATEAAGIDVSSQTAANTAINVIDTAIQTVSSERAKLGAYQNRLEHTINNLNTSSENLTASESRIRDVDMAKEMMEQTKNSILSQAAQAMLAQANQQPQGVLQLLR